MTVADHYRGLAQRGYVLADAMCNDGASLAAQTKSHNFIADFEFLRLAIAERPEAEVLQMAMTEFQFSLYALSIGSYRHAFSSLRLTFELLLAVIYFSAYEIKFRKWIANGEDIVWAVFIDKENGIFTNNFIRAFFPEMRTEGAAFRAMAEKVYRECSEYVHGNYHTHATADAEREFDAQLFAAWHDHADTMRLAFVFAFASRYLYLLPSAEKNRVEPIMIDSLGGLAPVQDIYSVSGGAT